MRQLGWDSALDAMTDLIHQARTKEGREYLDYFAESLGKTHVFDPRTQKLVPGNLANAYEMVGSLTSLLSHSDPMFVSGDLCEIINFAAESFQPEPFLETDLIAPLGFAYFERPIATHGRLMPHRGIQWGIFSNKETKARGLLIGLYGHKDHGYTQYYGYRSVQRRIDVSWGRHTCTYQGPFRRTVFPPYS